MGREYGILGLRMGSSRAQWLELGSILASTCSDSPVCMSHQLLDILIINLVKSPGMLDKLCAALAALTGSVTQGKFTSLSLRCSHLQYEDAMAC